MKEFFKVNILAFITKIIGALFSMLTIFYLTRILSKEEYSKYVLFTSTVNITTVIFFQWISVVVSRYLTLNPIFIFKYVKQKTFVSSSVLIVFCLFLSLTLKNFNILIICLASISFGLFNISIQIENSIENWSIYNLLLFLKYIITFIFLVVLIYFTKKSIFGLISLTLGSLIPLVLIKNKKRKVKLTFNKINNNLIYFGFTYTLILMSTSILDFADRYFLKYFKGDFDLSQYASNYDLIQQTVGGVLGVFAIYFMPKILKFKNINNTEDFNAMNTFFLNFTIIVGTFISINFFIAYPLISNVIALKYRYNSIAEIILIILAIYVSILKGTVFDLNLQIEGRNNILILNILIMTIINIILNYILIPKYSQLGAAFSTFFSFFVGLIISVKFSIKYFSFKKLFYYDFLKFLVIIFSICVLIKFIIVNINCNILLRNLLFSVLFISFLIVFNLFDSKLYFKKLKIKIFEIQ